MAKFLRTTADARFTNKGAKITNAEFDETLIDFHDDIDLINTNLSLVAGGGLQGIEYLDGPAETWNGESPNVAARTEDQAQGIFIPSASVNTEGTIVTIFDLNGKAGTNNITILCEGGELINDAVNYVISTAFESITLMAILDEGVNKMIIKSRFTP